MFASQFNIKVFADGADLDTIRKRNDDPFISGFTTNPTLMRKAGVADYKTFAHAALAIVGKKPISFEVFADDFDAMAAQALEIASWAENVYVKIPITNTRNQSSCELISTLSQSGVKVNVTAVTTFEQVEMVAPALSNASYISVFAGRIADTGVDPVPVIERCLSYLRAFPAVELLWASPRELFNIVQANSVGCHVITVTDDLLKKIPWLGRNLGDVSLDTVKMFYNDAQGAGYSIETKTLMLSGNCD